MGVKAKNVEADQGLDQAGAKIHWNSSGEGDPHMQDPLDLHVLRGKRVFCLALRSHHKGSY